MPASSRRALKVASVSCWSEEKCLQRSFEGSLTRGDIKERKKKKVEEGGRRNKGVGFVFSLVSIERAEGSFKFFFFFGFITLEKRE